MLIPILSSFSNSEFPFSLAGCHIEVKEHSLIYYLLIAGYRIIGFILFPDLCEMHIASLMIWTRIAVSNSYARSASTFAKITNPENVSTEISTKQLLHNARVNSWFVWKLRMIEILVICIWLLLIFILKLHHFSFYNSLTFLQGSIVSLKMK